MQQKVNYQLQTDAVIAALTAENRREKLLLHACCAPCASYVLEYLSLYFNITVFFCNPNITDKQEYEKRFAALTKLCNTAPFAKNITVLDDGYNPTPFLKAASGLEQQPEGGIRCNSCFDLRLNRTAKAAKQNGFSYFTTTLTISPHKNATLINTIGEKIAKEQGLLWLPADFKKRGGYLRSIELCKIYNIYRQNYCGCDFSRPKENQL